VARSVGGALMNRIRANGIEFAYLEEGVGPLVLLLHGFPDTAYSWSHQMPALAAAGYRAVAPYLRGYPPSEIPRDGFYDRGTLVADIVALIRALNGGAPVHLVGQDFGASITYGLIAAHPELVRRAVVMAVPHPAETAKSVLNARHVHRSFHWWFFQLPNLPEKALAENDFAFVDYLWEYWSSPGYRDTKHIAEIKRMLAEPGALAATLGYYRAMFDSRHMDPRHESLRKSMGGTIGVPTLALCGGDDMRAELMTDQAKHFSGEYRYEVVAGAGHFLHREKPAEVTRLVLDWLGNP
jgi:pimeloyl-ACP methyl ester carboxylesterase